MHKNVVPLSSTVVQSSNFTVDLFSDAKNGMLNAVQNLRPSAKTAQEVHAYPLDGIDDLVFVSTYSDLGWNKIEIFPYAYVSQLSFDYELKIGGHQFNDMLIFPLMITHTKLKWNISLEIKVTFNSYDLVQTRKGIYIVARLPMYGIQVVMTYDNVAKHVKVAFRAPISDGNDEDKKGAYALYSDLVFLDINFFQNNFRKIVYKYESLSAPAVTFRLVPPTLDILPPKPPMRKSLINRPTPPPPPVQPSYDTQAPSYGYQNQYVPPQPLQSPYDSYNRPYSNPGPVPSPPTNTTSQYSRQFSTPVASASFSFNRNRPENNGAILVPPPQATNYSSQAPTKKPPPRIPARPTPSPQPPTPPVIPERPTQSQPSPSPVGNTQKPNQEAAPKKFLKAVGNEIGIAAYKLGDIFSSNKSSSNAATATPTTTSAAK